MLHTCTNVVCIFVHSCHIVCVYAHMAQRPPTPIIWSKFSFKYKIGIDICICRHAGMYLDMLDGGTYTQLYCTYQHIVLQTLYTPANICKYKSNIHVSNRINAKYYNNMCITVQTKILTYLHTNKYTAIHVCTRKFKLNTHKDIHKIHHDVMLKKKATGYKYHSTSFLLSPLDLSK